VIGAERSGQPDKSEAFPGLFLGESELAGLMRRFDWEQTSIGSPDRWPESLKTAIRIILTSRQPFWIGWGQDLIYFYNDPYKSIIGGKHPTVLGQPTSVVWREIWDDIGPLLASALGGKEGTYVEEQRLIMERNGYPEETYYTFSYSPIFSDDGTPGGIICANTDDTQRVIGERQLALLRELAAGTVEARSRQQACERAAQALATNPYDLPFAMIYVSGPDVDALTRSGSTGIDRGQPVAPATLPLSRDDIWPVAAALTQRRPQLVSGLTEMFADSPPTGAWSRPPIQAIVMPLPFGGDANDSGVLIAGLNPFRLFDESYAGFLDLVVAQIATAITNAEAYEAERRRAEALAEIDRAKTAFFSNASHEFRTPLTLMLSPLEELLSHGGVQPSISVPYEEIELIHRNGLRLLKLVNTLLDFSRIEAGRFEAAYAPVDLSAYTAELASAFRSAIERTGLRFVVDCPPLPAPVHIDRGMWENIVLNLLSNAFKFTLDGEIAVAVSLDESGDWAVLTVRDTGVGIPEHELPRLFERFHRIDGQVGRSQEGTGIGLALVYELVKLHGGTVDVVSRHGEGTAFNISIPTGTAHLPRERLRREDAAQPVATRAIAFVEEALRWLPDAPLSDSGIEKEILGSDVSQSLPGARARVLLADDNADMRDYIRRLLETQYQVEAVGDGEAALAAARARRPDLVLSDVMMPRLDGFGLLRQLRADADLAEVPVVLLSARAGEEAQVEGLEAGADDYLTKPFSARELLARVGSNLSLARLRQGAAAVLREETHRLEVLNRTATTLAAELELEPLVQVVTDAATELTGAKFGAFFYNVTTEAGESYLLYTLSGASMADFEGFPQPRNTAIFAPTFSGEGIVRSGDIRKDPRYGHNAPHNGPPQGHLPVVSYLAVPVIARSGEVLGGLFFAHPEPDRFTARHELIVAGIASQAAVAFEKARLYRESRNAEASLRQLNETLEQRVDAEVAQRMQAEEALRQAQKMEAIGQLTGGVAHDFNNLLQVVLGNLDTLRRRIDAAATPPRSELMRLVEGAMRGAERAAILTQRLLAFSRRQPLEPRPVDVNRLVTGMSELLRRTLGENIAIETVLGGGLWRIHADPNQLENSIINLAVNARDAMPNGGRLTIESANAHLDEAYAADQKEVQPGQYVMLAVSDTGAGMSKEVIASAFDPFFTTKDVGQGTGLGLSQVYGFVKQSNGHVNIYSELGEGTTVRIYLPRMLSDVAVDENIAISAMPAGDGNEIILLVEDDEAVRQLNAATLRELNYAVIEAEDAPKALQILEIVPNVCLLFTDVGLPGGMNGRQLAHAALRMRPKLRVLFTTGYARNAIVHHGRLDPGIDLIGKPFTAAALATKIRELLDKM
jgi:signal transduction histidine kinase/DNA-binding response OmpR family regulator